MKITIKRIVEFASSSATLDVYVNDRFTGKLPPRSALDMEIPNDEAVVYVKKGWCESNRLTVSSNATLKVYVGSAINTFLNPKDLYVLEREA